MTKAQKLAAGLQGDDLYAALRSAAAGLSEAEAEALPGAILAAATPAVRARLQAVDAGLLRAVVRRGAGFAATRSEAAVRAWLAEAAVAPLFEPEICSTSHLALLTGGQHPDMPAFSDRRFDGWFKARGVRYGLGPYGEARTIYATDQFADAASPERRTRHLGIDVFAPVRTAVHAPLAGRVAFVRYNADPLDYGHTLILEHDTGSGRFWTLYGHLAGSLPGFCAVGDRVAAGQQIAHLGDWHENGGWAAHVHFQVMTDMLAQTGGNFFGVGHASLWDVWQGICIDPNLILRLPESCFVL
ncbi:MAG: peptidoglycan DD-metalloendopeptidase family protein [Pseudorhodobacter sp.]|nr:peptidoglycan DD-metalloendopeptidase family protein [Pseudorhodobacter sp.]